MKINFAVMSSVSALALSLALSPAAMADDAPIALSDAVATADDSLGAGGAAANDRSVATDDNLFPVNGAAATDGAYAIQNAGSLADRGGIVDNDGFELNLNVGDLVVELGSATATLSGTNVLPIGSETGFATGQFFNVSLSNSEGVNVVNANTGIASQATHFGFAAIVK